METIQLIKTADKVAFKLSQRPRTQGKRWLADQLGISHPTLYSKLKDNSFTAPELARLKELGLL